MCKIYVDRLYRYVLFWLQMYMSSYSNSISSGTDAKLTAHNLQKLF